MKDKRIWHFKRRAEEDNWLSAGACRMILRLSSWRYCTKHHLADAEFAISWKEIASWYDFDGPESIKHKDTIYGWFNELVTHGYLIKGGLVDCPPKRIYKLDLNRKPLQLYLFRWDRELPGDILHKTGPSGGKIRQLKDGKIMPLIGSNSSQTSDGKNSHLIYKYPFRKKCTNTKGKKQARCAREGLDGKEDRSSSLCSDETSPFPLCNEQDASTMPDANQSPAEDRALSSPDNPSAAERTGGTNPPGRGRKTPASPAALQQSSLLEMAKALISNGSSFEFLTARHVRALLKAGITLPPVVAEKFDAICEEFNPLPG